MDKNIAGSPPAPFCVADITGKQQHCIQVAVRGRRFHLSVQVGHGVGLLRLSSPSVQVPDTPSDQCPLLKQHMTQL